MLRRRSNQYITKEFLWANQATGITAPSIGDSNGNRLVLDHESIWRECKAEELRSYGYRRVENLLSYSEDNVNLTFPTQANAVIAANTIELTGTGNSYAYLQYTPVAGRDYIFRAKIQAVSGADTNIGIRLAGAGAADVETVFDLSDGQEKVISLPITTVSTATLFIGVDNRAAEISGVNTAPTKIVFTELQLEDSTGRSDTTTPSEYVPSGVGTGPELVTNGTFDTDTTGWTAGNGATLASVGGEFELTSTGTASPFAYQDISCIVGATYVITCTGRVGTAANLTFDIQGIAGPSTTSSTDSTLSLIFTATSTTHRVELFINGSAPAGVTVYADNVSAKRIDHGANVDGVKYFTTLNGNTVNSNVLTEATGAAISSSTLKGYFAEGAATEFSGYSADIGNWSAATTATVAQNAVGLTGASNEAFTITDNSAAAAQERRQNTTITSSASTYYALARIAYNASPSVYPSIRLLLTGGTDVNETIVFDPSDGSTVEAASDGAVVSSVRVGDFWQLLISATDNSSGNTTCQLRITPAYNTDGTTTGDVTAQGSTVFASCELYKDTWSFSPVLTTGGTTKTRAADVEATIDGSVWPDGDVSVEFEVTPFFDVGLVSQFGILAPLASAVDFIFFHTTAKSIRLSDGSQSTTKSSAWTNSGDTINVKVRANASSGKMNFSVDGVSATEANYDGSFNPSGNITLFKSLTLGAAIKNLRILGKDQGEGWLAS